MNTEKTDKFLKRLLDAEQKKRKVTVYLVNGIKLQGSLVDFDDASIELTIEKGSETQLVMRPAISTIKPD